MRQSLHDPKKEKKSKIPIPGKLDTTDIFAKLPNKTPKKTEDLPLLPLLFW